MWNDWIKGNMERYTKANWVSNQPKQIYTKQKKIYTHNRNAIYFSFFFFSCFLNCKHNKRFMGASSDSSTIAKYIKLGCLVGFIFVGLTSLLRYIFGKNKGRRK